MANNEMNGSVEENREGQREDQCKDAIVKAEDVVAEEAPAAEEKVVEERNEKNKDDSGDDTVGFDELELPDGIVNIVRKIGPEIPSPIQATTILTLTSGRDAVGLAQTGTGKAAAFAPSILARIDCSIRAPQALVLTLTHELALQVADSFQSLAGHLGKIQVLPIYGDQSYGVQLSGLCRGAQIIVGTSGRIIDHPEKGSLDISNLRFLVPDEADEMLQMGFQEDVEHTLADTPDDGQVVLFSVTMPASIRRLSKQYLTESEEITVKSQTRAADNIRQRSLMVSHRNKLDALIRILEVEESEAMTMSVRIKYETEEPAEKLRVCGFSVTAVNGDIPQTLRKCTIDQFKDGRLDISVATDVVVRGLDVDHIPHVVNYDIPHDTESYVHHIGRTGHVGRSSETLLLVTPREGRLLRSIERAAESQLHETKLPTVDEVNDSRKQKFVDDLTEALADSQVPVFRELTEECAEEHDTPLVDITAAIAAQAQSDDLLMKELPRGCRRDRDRDRFDCDRNRDRDGHSRGGRGQGKCADLIEFDREDTAIYRISVGRRQHIHPGAIVGATVNEGGLSFKGFGRIDIRGDHTLVELPVNLSQEVINNLSDTRISGQLIGLKLGDGTSVDDSDDYHGGHGDYRGSRRGGGRGRGGYRGGCGRGRDDRCGGGSSRGDYRGNFDDGDDFGGRGHDRGGYRGDRDDRRGNYRGGRR